MSGARRVLVFRALQLGDMLNAAPALRSLRAGMPGAHVTLAGLPWATELGCRFAAFVDDVVVFPGAAGLRERPSTPEETASFVAEMRERRFDLAIQLHGDGTVTNRIVLALGARETAGFYPAAASEPPPGKFIPYPTRGHERDRLSAMMRSLGMPDRGRHLEFAPGADDRLAARVALAAAGLREGRYVCVHAGARDARRRWHPSCFAAVGDALASDGISVVLTGSSGEAPIARAVRGAMRSPAIDLTGATDLGALAAVVEGAALLVSNDTGVAHLAEAVGAPSVVASRNGDRERWSPPDSELHRWVSVDGVRGESVAAVLAAARPLLTEGMVHVA